MSHNVPAVYDVFAVAIRETVGFQQPQKCGGEKPHKGRRPTGVFRSPRALLRPKHIQSCYMPLGCFTIFSSSLFLLLISFLIFIMGSKFIIFSTAFRENCTSESFTSYLCG